jgi:hypothetical protein
MMSFAGLLAVLPIPAPDFTGATRTHLLEPRDRTPEQLTAEQRRVKVLAESICHHGEKRDKPGNRNQNKEMRHARIISFLSKVSAADAMDAHEISEELGLYYTTTCPDLATIRRSGKVSFSEPSRSGIGRRYWGKE